MSFCPSPFNWRSPSACRKSTAVVCNHSVRCHALDWPVLIKCTRTSYPLAPSTRATGPSMAMYSVQQMGAGTSLDMSTPDSTTLLFVLSLSSSRSSGFECHRELLLLRDGFEPSAPTTILLLPPSMTTGIIGLCTPSISQACIFCWIYLRHFSLSVSRFQCLPFWDSAATMYIPPLRSTSSLHKHCLPLFRPSIRVASISYQTTCCGMSELR